MNRVHGAILLIVGGVVGPGGFLDAMAESPQKLPGASTWPQLCRNLAAVPTPDTSTRHLYVSPAGSDGNAGTAAAPFKTIQKAANLVTEGTTVHVTPGIYNESVRTTKSGTAVAPINYVADVKGGAVIKPSWVTGAIWYNSGAHVTIKGFEIDGTNSPAVRIGIVAHGNHVYVRNNKVHHILLAGADDPQGGGGIVLNGGYYLEFDQNVIGNEVHHVGTENSTRVHGIYHQSTGSIANNIVHSNPGTGIVTWHDPRDIVIANNTVVHNGAGLVVGSGDHYQPPAPADNIWVINNLVAFNKREGIGEAGLTGYGNVYAHNLVFGNGTDWSLKWGMTHSGTVTADPELVQLENGSYAIGPKSPVIDRGTTAYSAPTSDIHGRIRTLPDVGAIEWCSN